jgi:bacillopeptidase F
MKNKINMKTLALTSLVLIFASSSSVALAAAKLDPALRAFAEGQSEKKTMLVIALMEVPPTEGITAPSRYNTRQVVAYLKKVAMKNQNSLQEYFSSQQGFRQDTHVVPKRTFWINSSFALTVTPEGLKRLAEAPGVSKIYANHKIKRDPSRLSRGAAPEAEIPYDLKDIQLDKLLDRKPELIGKNVVLGSVDTGVDGKHPALEGKVIGFYDAAAKKKTEPRDTDSHGTHTCGTMVGTGQGGALMGVAPGAKLVATAALSGYDDMIAGMQYMMDPDGDAATNDLPRAINSSWHSGGAPDQEVFYRAITAWEAAGILPVFSAGNAGPGDGTITHPKEHPSTFSVAATQQDGKAANFSSRGPGNYKGSPTQKPEISAPGVKIVSAVPGGKYAAYDGTSMAAPHVTGASAILFQIDPKLNPGQVRKIFLQSAVPMTAAGEPGTAGEWNKVYGFGKMNIYAAAELAMKVAFRRSESSQFMMMGSLITSPADLAAESILATESQDEKIEVLAYPHELEGKDWLKPSQIWN